eukprot:364326-Chlamydomonas_euryale.AAC.18
MKNACRGGSGRRRATFSRCDQRGVAASGKAGVTVTAAVTACVCVWWRCACVRGCVGVRVDDHAVPAYDADVEQCACVGGALGLGSVSMRVGAGGAVWETTAQAQHAAGLSPRAATPAAA